MAEKPIALVHVYGLHPRRPDKPEIRGQGQIRAAEALYQQGEIDGIVFAGGEVYEGKPPLRDVMAARLIQRGRIPPDRIFVVQAKPKEGITTAEEIELFHGTAAREGWTAFADIGNETHLAEIRDELRRIFHANIPTYATEEVLVRSQPRYSGLIGRGRESRDEQAFKRQQAAKMAIKVLPFGRLLLKTAAHIPFKGQIQTRVLGLLSKFR